MDTDMDRDMNRARRLVLPTETEVQRRFRAFCAAVEPLAEFAGLELEVAAGGDGEVVAQVAAPQYPHVPARTFWVHDDADEQDGVVCMRALMCYVHDFVCRATVFGQGDARLRDNGQAVAAAAWRVASEAPATRKGDAV